MSLVMNAGKTTIFRNQSRVLKTCGYRLLSLPLATQPIVVPCFENLNPLKATSHGAHTPVVKKRRTEHHLGQKTYKSAPLHLWQIQLTFGYEIHLGALPKSDSAVIRMQIEGLK